MTTCLCPLCACCLLTRVRVCFFCFFKHNLVTIQYKQFPGCVAVDPALFVLHVSTSRLDHRGLCKL